VAAKSELRFLFIIIGGFFSRGYGYTLEGYNNFPDTYVENISNNFIAKLFSDL